ncbi:MAG TPA: [Fe-Fe] hydrogenase large subunit C-terminal domain-containing protein [Candidatus Bilamarchaeaceae archaeon]|nr:[Fe-Fe] hydrogenase large subunit C-terminal domain-containing protein [Candidatus Bilamarchaeaceae archaeon]
MADEIYLNKPDALFAAIKKEKNGGKVMVAQLAPAVRVSLGEEFGRAPGEDLTSKCVGLLRSLGFDHVVDTPLGADINIYEEVDEILSALERGDDDYFPVFNSCCIGWRLYCKNKHPELYRLVSPIASPHMVAGSAAKHILAKKLGVPVPRICMVGIMPCVLKKYETQERMPSGEKYVDYVLSTQELAAWAKAEGKGLMDADGAFTPLLPDSTKNGVIFGATGGIVEALLTSLACKLGESPQKIRFRGDEQVKHLCVQMGKYKLNVVSIYGVSNLDKVLGEIRHGVKYHFVEVMNCPYGCVGGPGQPLPATEEKYRARAHGLRAAADRKPVKCPIAGKGIAGIYDTLGIEPGSGEARKLFYFNGTKI